MPKRIEYDELVLVVYYRCKLTITTVGYIVSGPGINEMHTTLVSAIIAIAEHVTRMKAIRSDVCFLGDYVKELKQSYKKILDRIEKVEENIYLKQGHDYELSAVYDAMEVLDEK